MASGYRTEQHSPGGTFQFPKECGPKVGQQEIAAESLQC